MKDKVILIGVAGGSGSGKSTLIERIKQEFKDQITVICHDSYYNRQVGRTYDERAKVNYDHPDAFETELMIEHLKLLKEGHEIEQPVYDYTIHNRSDETVIVNPARVIMVDGILIFENKELRDMFDIKVFVDTDADVRIVRRILRDVQERARSLESVITQYLTTVKPMHEQFVEPSKKYADIIIPEGGYNLVALGMLIHRIEGIINE
ncbi:MAG: uridine kinase [Clostridiales bacterium]|nr:uridine kinase [Clostridiales bacterium]